MSHIALKFQFWVLTFTCITVLVATVYDYKWRRIPNLITLPSIFLGLTMHAIHSGGSGFYFSLGGVLVGGGVFMIFYLMGGIGAGDVKLMGSVGAFLGADKVFTALILTALMGGLMAIYKIAVNYLFNNIFRISQKNNFNGNLDPLKDTIPYGIAIAVGTLITLTLL